MSDYISVTTPLNGRVAVGKVLSTTGSAAYGSTSLVVADPTGWVVGAGIAIQNGRTAKAEGAESGITLVTWVTGVSGYVLSLHDPIPNPSGVNHVAVQNDDSSAIQLMLDSLGDAGGVIYFPPGTYILGAPYATYYFSNTDCYANQPLVMGSNTTIRGAGMGATVLQLANEVRQFRAIDLKATNFDTNGLPKPCVTQNATIFVNKANAWWFGDQGGVWNSYIEVSDLTLDGNKAHQSRGYTSMGDSSLVAPAKFIVAAAGATGTGLPAGTYAAYARYLDSEGRESSPTPTSNAVVLSANQALNVTLPPVAPEGAQSVNVYIGASTDKDACGNPQYVQAVGNPFPTNGEVATAGARASLDCSTVGSGNVKTVIEAVAWNTAGNHFTITLLNDSPQGVSITFLFFNITIHYHVDSEDPLKSSTVANIQEAIGKLSGAARVIQVKDNAPAPYTLTNDDGFTEAALSGGTDPVVTIESLQTGPWVRYPGRVVYPGDGSSNTSFYLDHVNLSSYKQLEIRNFANDGFEASASFSHALLSSLYIHDNGRWGLGFAGWTGSVFEEVDVEDCIIDSNAGGVDIEP